MNLNITDGKSYLAFRAEWRAVYAHLTEMIRRAKLVRGCNAKAMGEAHSKCARVAKRKPNSDVRVKRLERFIATAEKAWLVHRDSDAVCRSLRREARMMMGLRMEVEASKPKRAI